MPFLQGDSGVINAYILVSAFVMAFNAFIWSGTGPVNVTVKLIFCGLGFWGAVMVAKAFVL
jgi:hypothetical protein